MEPIYETQFFLRTGEVDRFDRLHLSHILDLLQQSAGDHCSLLGFPRETLGQKGLFWAVLRHRVVITRLPRAGETVRVQTWPMPTTRTAYPRAAIALDEKGQELFRSVSLWVLMDWQTRSMVLPGKSGVTIDGILRGCEPEAPRSLPPCTPEHTGTRRVCFPDLDLNGHMNNCRYMDWVQSALPSDFHGTHTPKEFTACYLAEAREGDELALAWTLGEGGTLDFQSCRPQDTAGHTRVFAARVQF